MQTQHTPGPWFITGGATRYIEARIGDGLIQEVAACGPTMADVRGYGQQQEANARLIAAAPDLLEALIELADCGAEAWGEDRPCVKWARAAIAKATGEQP